MTTLGGDAVDDDSKSVLDKLAKRALLWLTLLTGIVSAVSASSAWVVTKSNAKVIARVQSAEAKLAGVVQAAHEKATADSVRFERAMQLVELTASAWLEPEGSPERQGVIAELRRRRTFTPR